MDPHTPEPRPGPSGEATVVLDIGGDRGALVITTGESLVGLEIEVHQRHLPWDGTHTAVRRREVRPATQFAGVFGSLPAGEYEARLKGIDRGPVVGAVVVGGKVTQVAWPEETPPNAEALLLNRWGSREATHPASASR